LIRYCDRIAYLNHDIDDAIRSGFIGANSLPEIVSSTLGQSHRERINTMVADIIDQSMGIPEIRMSKPVAEAMQVFREFMFREVYFHPSKVAEEERLEAMVEKFYDYYITHFACLPPEYQRKPHEDAVCDYIAGMTDSFALNAAAQIIP